MQRRTLLAAALVGLLALPGAARSAPVYNPPPEHVRGTIESFDGHTLVVKTREGPALSMTLSPKLRIGYHVKETLADIKRGDFVASTGVRGTDGRIHAVELRIFPASMYGAGEGQYPWDLEPRSIMTNAYVDGTATAKSGEILYVDYKIGHGKKRRSEFIVGPECPIYAYVPGDTSLLKPGAAVFAIAAQNPDGSLTAIFIAAEHNGVKPPM
jgi:hypothetical protein